MTEAIHKKLTALSTELSLGVPESISILGPHASPRVIARLYYQDKPSLVGVVHEDLAENNAFIGFSKAFHKIGLAVPKILGWNGEDAYIETDLGDESLYDHLKQNRNGEKIADSTKTLYQKTLTGLVDFQTRGLKTIDLDLCYRGKSFDVPAIVQDFDAFIQDYAKRSDLEAEAIAARPEFEQIISEVAYYRRGFFMYRDFQARNVMIKDNQPFFIDYQSGREGPLAYDLASLLFQASANLPFDFRNAMLDHYLDALSQKIEIDRSAFKQEFIFFVLMRSIQVMGAYGRLGLGQGKEYFLNSIPFGKKNLKFVLEQLPNRPYLDKLLSLLEKVVKE